MVEQVHILHGLVDHVVVFRLQFCPAVREQELHKRVEELDVGLCGLQRKRVHARPVLADAVNLASIQFDNTFVAAADIEDVGKAAVLLFQRDDLIPVNGLPGARRPDDEHDPNAVHIRVLEERRPRARLEDVEVLGIEVVRVRMSDMRSEHRRETSVMIFGQPHRKDVELVVARKHGVEGREIAERLFHHLGAGIYENPMHRWHDIVKLVRALGC